MRTDVYWNLHKHIWSLRQKGKVIAHMGTVVLSDVTFRVQPAGRERVRREGKKNVHAFAQGNYEMSHSYKDYTIGRRITYNPYKNDTFVYADDLTPVTHSDRILLQNKRIWELI